MLSPDTRSLYTSALTPPTGFLFDQALATTYSLDLTTLLVIPLHLALLHQERGPDPSGIALLEALRRVIDRTTVYAQRGRMQVPQTTHVLYAQLESMVIEANAPNGGAFHPKLWLLRFVKAGTDDLVLLRLLVLTRNITADRSWDLSLQLEGRLTGRYIAENRALGELVRDLPAMAKVDVPEARRVQAEALGEEIRKTRWQPPPGYESVAFHVLGRAAKPWMPPASQEMVVISPFVTAPALRALSETTDLLRAVISRPEELDALPADARTLARQWLTLNDAAETEDGEAPESWDTLGLHAKAYVLRQGWDTKLFIGSANASSAALLAGSNIEVLAELTGKRSRVKGIEDLLGPDGLGSVLSPYAPPTTPEAVDEAEQAAEEALEHARSALAATDLRVRCARADEEWKLTLILSPGHKVTLDGIVAVRVWMLTVTEDRAADALPIAQGAVVEIGRFATASVTGLLAFELVAAAKTSKRLRFALNLPVDGLPPDRDAAIMRTVVRNRDGFLRYLLLLLGDIGIGEDPDEPLKNGKNGGSAWLSGASSGLPLLEELTRAFSRDPERLREVGRVIERLRGSIDGAEIVPHEFLELWDVFERALAKEDR